MLGKGGMGEVYIANDLKLDRKVAIKFLPEQLTKEKENVERFEREAKAAAALNHPNIINKYDKQMKYIIAHIIYIKNNIISYMHKLHL